MPVDRGGVTGVRVKEAGLVVVHKEEVVFPALGSEAITEPVALGAQTVINYYFPVEIVIVGGLPEEEHQAIQARLWEKFGDALDRIA
ncbi:MAG TPA: hypothetical protein VFE78_04230 [Gemmataceae bacterium]|jgi:hypothetical protein|nr:hypothetical protein [Gemmataceae bacterium]